MGKSGETRGRPRGRPPRRRGRGCPRAIVLTIGTHITCEASPARPASPVLPATAGPVLPATAGDISTTKIYIPDDAVQNADSSENCLDISHDASPMPRGRPRGRPRIMRGIRGRRCGSRGKPLTIEGERRFRRDALKRNHPPTKIPSASSIQKHDIENN